MEKFTTKIKLFFFNFQTWFSKDWGAVFFFIALVFAVYFNSFGNDFVSDDVTAILKNKEIGKISFAFSSPSAFLRPLLNLIIYSIFGLNPLFFRLLNVFFHIGAVIAVYFLIKFLIDRKTAFFSASILAVHPIEIEAVAWISGGPYVQYSFFFILALLFYFLSKKKKGFYAASVIVSALSIFSSDKGIVFPITLLLFIFSFESLKKNWKKTIPFFIIFFIFVLVYIGRFQGRIESLKTDYYQESRFFNPLFQIPIAITFYLKLIFWPSGLTLYHTEMAFTWTEYLVRLAIFIIFLGVIVWAYFWKHRQIFFWLCFFIVALSLTLTPFGISWIVAERYVYLGSIGIFIVAAILFRELSNFKNFKIATYIIFSLVIMAFSIRTIVRNIDWKNEDNLWLSAAATSPSSQQNHNNLGDYYARHGNLEKAAEEFKTVIRLNPRHAAAYHNLGNIYYNMGRKDDAAGSYLKALSINQNLWQSYQGLAIIYFEKGDFGLAQENFVKAIEINNSDSILRVNLGITYVRLGDKEKAKKEFEEAFRLDPENQKIKDALSAIK